MNMFAGVEKGNGSSEGGFKDEEDNQAQEVPSPFQRRYKGKPSSGRNEGDEEAEMAQKKLSK